MSIMTDDWCDRLHANQTESGVRIVTDRSVAGPYAGEGGSLPQDGQKNIFERRRK